MRTLQARLTAYLGQGITTIASFAVILGIFGLATVAVSLLPAQKVQALEQCQFSEQIGGANFTEGNNVKSSVIGDQLCVGPAFGPSSASGFSVFEFIVKFNGPVKDPKISFENNKGGTGDMNPLSGQFQRVNDTTYVVKPEKKAGYIYLGNFQSNLGGCSDNGASTVKVSVEANGKKQNFSHNLCEAIEFNRDYSKQFIADQIPADGQSSTGNGRVVGEFTTVRFGAPEGVPERNGRSNKRCVTEIALAKQGTNPQNPGETKTGNQDSDWYSLVDGKLEIPNVEPGKYNLRITYNDRLCMQQDFPNAAAEYTIDNLVVVALGFEVKAGEETKVTLVNERPDGEGQGQTVEDPPVCTTGNGLAGALGWVLCPVAALIANATEFIEKNIILPYLTVSPLNTNPDNPAYLLWQAIRNVANIAFILAFFMVIFSQATSIGISNYGIKRLLPRIAVVALGTNLSYFIAAFLIDAFNVFGAGVGQLVMEALKAARVGEENYDPSAGQFWALGGVALTAVLFKAGPVLGWLFGLIGIAFLIVLVAVIVLVIRQMLIIGLVAISPLAFVAWLLPNTEKYAYKARDTFIQLLIMYPFIVLLFASGKIFGALLGNPNYTLVGEDTLASGDVAEAIRVVFQFFVTVLPLGGLLFAIAFSSAMLGKAAGVTRRLLRQAGQKASDTARGSKLGRFVGEKLDDRRTRRAGTPPGTMANPLNWKRGAAHRFRQTGAYRTLDRASGGFGTYLQRENAAAKRELREKAQKFLGGDLNAAFALEAAGGNAKDLRKIIKQGYFTPTGQDGQPLQDANGNDKKTYLGQDTQQRLQQFLSAGNYKGSAGATAIARTLADTNQLNGHKYKRLAGMAAAEGAEARDEFIAEQNVYNDSKGLSHLAQAGWGPRLDAHGTPIAGGGEGFNQFASNMGLKTVDGVFSGLKLGETKKQVFQDPEIKQLIGNVGQTAVTNGHDNSYTTDNEYRRFVRESLKMKPDQLKNFTDAMGYAAGSPELTNFQKHQQWMRNEMAAGVPNPGGATPPPPPGGGGGRRGPVPPPPPPGGGGGRRGPAPPPPPPPAGGGWRPAGGGGGGGPIPHGPGGGGGTPPAGGGTGGGGYTPPSPGGGTPPPAGGGGTTGGGGYTPPTPGGGRGPNPPPQGGGGGTGNIPPFYGAPQGGGAFNPRNNPGNTPPTGGGRQTTPPSGGGSRPSNQGGGGAASGSQTAGSNQPPRPTAQDYGRQYGVSVNTPAAGSSQIGPVVDLSQQAYDQHKNPGESRIEFNSRMMDVQRKINDSESNAAQAERNSNVVAAPPPAPTPSPSTPPPAARPSSAPVPPAAPLTGEALERALRGEFDSTSGTTVNPERDLRPTEPASTPPPPNVPTPPPVPPRREPRRATRPQGPPSTPQTPPTQRNNENSEPPES